MDGIELIVVVVVGFNGVAKNQENAIGVEEEEVFTGIKNLKPLPNTQGGIFKEKET